MLHRPVDPATRTGPCAEQEPDVQARATRDVRLLNHFVRALQQDLRDREAEHPGGLQIDHQLELRGLLDGKIAGFATFEDLIDVRRVIRPRQFGLPLTKDSERGERSSLRGSLGSRLSPWLAASGLKKS